jgi:hypothetical protein
MPRDGAIIFDDLIGGAEVRQMASNGLGAGFSP